MKFTFIFIFLILGINLQAQQDTCKWLKNNAEWCYAKWSPTTNQDLAQIRVESDTLINNRLCSILGLYDEGVFVEESKLICFYEEENEFVYFYEGGVFNLLYNFSLSVLPGDTVSYFLPSNFKYYDISSSQGAFEPTTASYQYRFVGQEWVELTGGEMLRIVQTEQVPNADGECYDLARIIDGVGSNVGFLGRSCNQLTAGFSEFFRGFDSNDLSYTEVEGCIVTSIDNINNTSIQVFPNPTNNRLNIQSEEVEIVQVRLYSSLGQKVLGQKVQSLDVEFSVRDYAVGVYWLDVELHGGSSYREKVLILNVD